MESNKTFISFLGVTHYIPCHYSSPFDRKITYLSSFVKEAIIRFILNSSVKNFRVVIFLTKDARNSNWSLKDNREGLYEVLERLKSEVDFEYNVFGIDIPDVRNEEDIWKIFKIVGENIPDNTEVIFDITHAFRFLPMLGITLVNYLRFVKNITLSGIYYGAVEMIGSMGDIQEMTPESRKVPILDLTPFEYIMRFTNATSDFVNYGSSSSLKDVIIESEGRYPYVNGSNKAAFDMFRNFADKLDTVAMSLKTNRGLSIYEGTIFNELRDSIQKMESIDNNDMVHFLLPVLERVEEKVSGFRNNNIYNGIEAARWCIEHNLIQQGITILHETMITIACAHIGIDYTLREWREFAGKALNLVGRFGRNAQLEYLGVRILELDSNKTHAFWKFLGKDDLSEFVAIYMMIMEYRNFINHAGTLAIDKKQPEDFVKLLHEAYKKIIKIHVNKTI